MRNHLILVIAAVTLTACTRQQLVTMPPGTTHDHPDLGEPPGDMTPAPDLLPEPPGAFTISPADAHVGVGQTLQLHAGRDATWRVVSGDGSIDASGLYTAGAREGTVALSATATADPSLVVTTHVFVEPLLEAVAGGAPRGGSSDGTAANARFLAPAGLLRAPSGVFYIADTYNATIRVFDPTTGIVTTLAGSPGQRGNVDGSGATARFSRPTGLQLDAANGILYVADPGTHTVRAVTVAGGSVTTIAGGAGSAGYVDEPGTLARFSSPSSLVLAGGKLYVADSGNTAVRVIDLANGNSVTTLAGRPGGGSDVDGSFGSARFDSVVALAPLSGGLAVLERVSYRRIDLTAKNVSTIPVGSNLYFAPITFNSDGAGTLFTCNMNADYVEQSATAPYSGTDDGTGCGLGLLRVGTDSYYFDGNALVVRHGLVAETPLAGFQDPPVADGVGATARFGSPGPVLFDGDHTLWVGDAGSLRRVDLANGAVTTDPASTTLRSPTSLARVGGTLYIADFGNLYALDVARDQLAQVATTYEMSAIASDGTQLYAISANDHTVASVAVSSATATATVLAGVSGQSGGADGSAGTARFTVPTDVTFAAGKLLVLDGNGVRSVDASSGETYTIKPGDFVNGHISSDGKSALVTNHGLTLIDLAKGTSRAVVAGGPTSPGVPKLGLASQARVASPAGVALLPSGDVVFADGGYDDSDPSHAGGQLIVRLRGLAR